MCDTPVRNKLLLRTKSLTIPPSPLMQTLGYGTGVTVYKLERSPSRSPWVLKKISRKNVINSDEMNVRLKCEAALLKTLKHPNIVGFRALITQNDGRKCIAMEDCTISLGDLIEQRAETTAEPFPATQITKVASDVASGLKYLHDDALVLHCDIKSFNILVKNDFEICKICDFGVSMPLQKDGTLDSVKAGPEAEYVGTGPWMAPEVIEASESGQVITTKADIYAYGLTLWEMIALDIPFSDNIEDIDDSLYADSLNNGDDADEESSDEEENVVEEEERVRPKVPCESLDDSYLNILQIFYLCTDKDYKKRPHAREICDIIKKELKVENETLEEQLAKDGC